MVETRTLSLKTRGHADMIDITQRVAAELRQSGIQDGIVVIFSPSSTSGLTTIEYESGALSDFKRLFDQIASEEQEYRHNLRWGDGNGYAHVRAALLKASLTVPFTEQRLLLGTWQQIIFVDFDNRPRQRRLILQIMGDPAAKA